MATTLVPNSTFRLATVRAPRKPFVEEVDGRTITYTQNSTFYGVLKNHRAGADPRQNLINDAVAFKALPTQWIGSVGALKSLFPNFGRIDDYLREKQKDAVKADLKALVEGPDVLNATAASYVSASGYSALKSRVWDNIFALTILGDNSSLRSEELLILRLLNIIEKLASNSPVLSTGPGIFGAYMSTVLLPNDVFPLPDVPLPSEPETQPEEPDPTKGLGEELQKLQAAYTEIQEAYNKQTYEYKALKYPPRKEDDPDDSLQKNLIDHDPLALSEVNGSSLKTDTVDQLSRWGIRKDFVYMPEVHDKLGGEIRRLGREVNAKKERQSVVRVGETLIMLGNECVRPALESPCKPFVFAQWPGGAGLARPIGVADLKVVQTQLYKYELGEVAHIENILRGETRTRSFRDLERQETTLEQEQETTTENTHESQTTERFELHQEANNIVQQDQAKQAGVTASVNYGPTGSATISAGTSSSTSQAQASAQATSYAKEVMDRALERVIERSRTKRTVTTIVETEDITEHSFKNTPDGAGGTENITGVYRWLDKLYYNKVVNYGRRMMFEFVIPEPAAFYLFSKLAKPKSNEVFEAPAPFTITSFEEITPFTYDDFAVQFGAVGLKPPPTTTQAIQWARDFWPGPGDTPTKTFTETVTVPEGYVATSAKVTFLITPESGQYITVSVGGSAPLTRYVSEVMDILDLPQTGGELPIMIKAVCNLWAVSFIVYCKPTTESYQQWQIDTYASLKTAYDKKVSDYNRWLNQQSVNSLISGTNPAANRNTERKELKKHCIEFISGQRFESFDAMRNNVAPFGYPEFSFTEATAEGKYIQFFEQAFEWDQMTYLFYPYYWARKKEWVNILQRDENDPLFMEFLQAGAARVLIPVRNEYVKAVLHYLNTGGEIWNGEDVPAPNDPLYVSIIDEIQEADGFFEGGLVEGEPWLSKVPTSLVYLEHQNTPNDLPDFSADLPL